MKKNIILASIFVLNTLCVVAAQSDQGATEPSENQGSSAEFTEVSLTSTPQIPEIKTEASPSETKSLFRAMDEQEDATDKPTLVASIFSVGKKQILGLTAGAALVGYGIYKVVKTYFMKNDDQSKEPEIVMSIKDRDLLVKLLDVMLQDIKNIRGGKRKSSLVKQFDISELSMPLVIVCNSIQNDFVQLYNQCDDQGNNVDLLNMFYCQVNDAIKSLIDKATIA